MTNELEQRIEEYFDRLWPLNRCVMGPGYDQSLAILKELVDFEELRFPTGSEVFDWTIPKQWEVKEAYLLGPDGKRYADFAENNLHLVAYSIPVREKITLKDLRERLHTLPELPEAIPYVTSVYKEYWGFCLDQNTYDLLPEGEYEVVIDSILSAGHLQVGEAVLEGSSDQEVLFSSYLCHPSMANNELSGPLVLSFLYQAIKQIPNRRYTYRFVICPETIGAVAFLSTRGKHLKDKLVAGFQLTCMGDDGLFTYKRSRIGNSLADRAALAVLSSFEEHKVSDFKVTGSDERQYCSPGFNLPVGSFMRTRYDQYKEYHTSLDNKDFISFKALAGSVNLLQGVVELLENNRNLYSKVPFGEPQLSKRDLYPTLSRYSAFNNTLEQVQESMFWLLNLADGQHDLITVVEKSGCNFASVIEAAKLLEKSDLLTIEEINYDQLLGR